MFHFLTEEKDRERYLANLRRSLKPGGYFVIAAFADDGPLKCSGLEVERYSIEKLAATVGKDFELLDSFKEIHNTPFGTQQSFTWARFRMREFKESDSGYNAPL